MTLTITGLDNDVTITGVTLNVKNNKNDGNGTATVKIGESTLGTMSIKGLGSTYQNKEMTITPTKATSALVITISASANSVYCNNFVVYYEEPALSYTLTATSNNDEYGSVSVSGNKITATPNTGYRISLTTPYQVTSGTAKVAQDGNIFTVTADADCTVQINFEAIPSHNATFYANGNVFETVSTIEGASVTFPSTTPSAIVNKEFVGWTTAEITGTTNEAPAFVTSAVMGDEALNFYAVYANVTKGDYTETTDVLDNAFTINRSDNAYSEWSNKTGNSSAVYAGQSAGDAGTIQLRSKDSNSGVIVTTSAGKVTKVVLDWDNSTTDGRTVSVYGKNTAYTAATDLYKEDTEGTLLGELIFNTNNDITELDITDDYAYIGLRSKNGALYLNSISITWFSGTPDSYSGYCTSVSTEIFEIGESGYATFSSDVAVSFAGSAVTAYTVQYTNGSAKLTAVEEVPAGAGVILEGDEDIYEVPVLASADALTDNDLLVSDGTITGGDNIFCLANGSNGVGFYRVDASVTIPAGKCYLEIPAQQGAARQFIGFGHGETTGIETVAADSQQGQVYDLQGRRIAHPVKGLYIVNGKKYVK